MEKKTINVKSMEEIENMTVENTSVDVALRERFIAITNFINELKAEKDKISEIVLEKYDHKPVKAGEIFKAIVYDTMTIDEEILVKLYGKDALKNTKVKPKHVEYIKAS